MFEGGLPANFTDIAYIRSAKKLNTSSSLLSLLMHSTVNSHVEIFRTGLKKAIGYVAWITVNKEGFILLNKTKKISHYKFEWNEGYLLVIYDVVFLPGWNYSAKKMLVEFLKTKKFMAFIKRGKVHAFVRKNNRYKRFAEKALHIQQRHSV